MTVRRTARAAREAFVQDCHPTAADSTACGPRMHQILSTRIHIPAMLGRSPHKITRMTLTIKLDRNWSSFQLANSAPPLSVTGSAIAPSARMHERVGSQAPSTFQSHKLSASLPRGDLGVTDIAAMLRSTPPLPRVTHDGCVAHSSVPCQCNT